LTLFNSHHELLIVIDFPSPFTHPYNLRHSLSYFDFPLCHIISIFLQCISLNDQWSKAHVRLASAYIALGNHSNDACLSLQRAISLDRNNKVARSMLVREMRERNSRERCGGGSGTEGNVATNGSSHHSREHNEENSNHPPSTTAPSAPPKQQQQQQQQHDDELDIDDIDEADDNPTSRDLPLQTIISQRIQQLISWYHSQSDDFQTLILVSILFVILYVALGGRFGFERSLLGNSSRRNGGAGGGGRTTRGNYGRGNAYERYTNQYRYPSEANNEAYDNYGRQQQEQQQQQQQEQQTKASTGFNDRTNPQNDGYYSSRYEYYDHEPRRGRGYGGGTTTSYHMVS
jgi:hypothetical protein